MRKRFLSINNEVWEYYTFGKTPVLYLHSGVHGDEWSIVPHIYSWIKENLKRMPGFIWIPYVSPSAIMQRSRKNRDGLDINRCFGRQESVNEVRVVKQIMNGHKFELCLSLHEDTEYRDFYLYDYLSTENSKDITDIINNFRVRVKSLGVGLLNGIDDPSDPELGYEFIDGYRAFPAHEQKEDGQFEPWAIREGRAKRVIEPEFPSLIPQSEKERLIDLVFEEIVLKFFALKSRSEG